MLFFKYLNLFTKILGKKVYFVFLLSFIASVLESLGFILVIPIFLAMENNGTLSESKSSISNVVFTVFKTFKIEPELGQLMFYVMVLFLIKGLFVYLALYISAKFRVALHLTMKELLVLKYTSLKYLDYMQKSSSYYSNVINEQVNRSLLSFNSMILMFVQLVNLTVYFCFAIAVSWFFSISAIALGICLIILFRTINLKVRNSSRGVSAQTSFLVETVVEGMSNYKYLYATSQISQFKSRVSNIIENLVRYELKLGKARAFTQAMREPFIVVSLLSLVSFSVFVVGNKISELIVSVLIFYRAMTSAIGIQRYWQGSMEYIGSVELVDKELTEYETTNRSNQTSELVVPTNDDLTIQNLSFRYPNANSNVLENVNFKIRNKEYLAIIGPSGGGKTTLVDILTGVLTPSSGVIMQGESVIANQYEPASWGKKIGYVAQEGSLFKDTIWNNVTMWAPKDNKDNMEKFLNAVNQAQISDFIFSLDKDVDTTVGERGAAISGGQKQRILLARELYKKPKVLVLDEATSALDEENETLISENIFHMKGEITIIAITHRRKNLKYADRVISIENKTVKTVKN